MTEPATLQPVAKPHSVRRLGPVDVAPLRAQVARLSEKVWREADAVKENDFFCFAHTRHIVFRFLRTGSRRLARRADRPAQARAVMDTHGEVMARFGYPREEPSP